MNGDAPNKSGAPDNRVLDANVRAIAVTAGVKLEGEPDALSVARTMAAEIERLAPFETVAHDGRVLRAALVEEALAEGVRAFGNDFNKEAKQRMLENLDVETIREMRESWKVMGNKALGGGGRRSVESPDGDTPAPEGDGDDAPETPENPEKSGEGDDETYPVPEDAIGSV